MTRTFVVGLDGASWRLIDPWIEQGELPTLERLRESGTWATSESCLPPVTFPNWKCYSSGKNPGQLGVYWFERIDLETPSIDVMNGSDFETAELWDYLNEAGYSTGVVNMPTMYPPRKVDGPIVSGGPDAVDGEYRSIEGGYTSPAELEAFLEEEFDYAVHPEPMISSNEERGEEVDAILELLELRFEVALRLLEDEQLDFVHVTLFYLNVLQHFFWNDEPTLRAWKIVDSYLDRIDQLEDTNLIVMSDHGCAPTDVEFFINEWLAENGYLTKERTIEDYLTKIGLNRENALSVAKRLGLVDVLSEIVPERIQQLVPQSAGIKRERKLEKIVLSETAALASGQGPVYINPAFDVESIREEIIEELRQVTDSNGEPLFEAVHRSEEVYSGSKVDIGPEIVIESRPGVLVNDGIGGGPVQTKPQRWEAENSLHGIFLASGPSFEPTENLDDVRILDLAPTILASYGLDVPTDMDGSVLPVLSDGQDVGTRRPIDLDTTVDGHHEEVADRLKQLGYME
jgi:predicted AlkP superfamily phosphohydrolase/phosphomutase